MSENTQHSELSPKMLEILRKLEEKHDAVGENLEAHLEGLFYSYFVNYWDYIGIDALLNLQKPKTKYSDEMIFIIYHQISELFFKMILHEIEQIGNATDLTPDFFLKKINRINAYYDHLLNSFNLLSVGLESEQFMKFRKTLTPASGFQSIQYRLIEVWSTHFSNLLDAEDKANLSPNASVEDVYQHIYWKKGATYKKTQQKTLTLLQFEEKYSKLIIRKGKELKDKNILSCYLSLPPEAQNNPTIIEALRQFDKHANLNWPMAHYGYAIKHLQKDKEVVPSTGGTNWQQYLPPHFNKILFYPNLWSEKEKKEWGKEWIEKEILSK